MKYYNINKTDEVLDFKQAAIKGLGTNKGLFVPERIPTLEPSFFDKIETMSNVEIGVEVMRPYVGDIFSEEELTQIISETVPFDFPVHTLNNQQNILELFHGPTMAFKDVGARFMARCFGHFAHEKHQQVNILVATSGDTGSAVAQGFYKVSGVNVIILFPKGKVSDFQEYQMTSLGKNITAVEIDGTFDDCQAFVKKAFLNKELNHKFNLSSANSINVARFLPQMLYYFFAYKQLKQQLKGKEWVVSVPSGNLGNITAGLYAQRMGLPIARFVASNNDNKTFYQYLKTGEYLAQKSVTTYSNAMDVGDPSNFDRIVNLYKNNVAALTHNISGAHITDSEVVKEIKKIYAENKYVIDPHCAVGLIGLQQNSQDENEVGTVLATASPYKFIPVIQKAIPTFPFDKNKGAIKEVKMHKYSISNSFVEYEKILEKVLG